MERYYEPFDPDYIGEVIDRVFGPALDHYFRPRLLRGHRLPDRGPAILAANHSGTCFPYDGMALQALLWRRGKMGPDAPIRAVFEKELAQAWWMRPFGIDNFWRRGGGVDMTFDNFDRLLARGERVLYFPEGVPGIGKGFYRRYQLQRFSTSFVILAAQHRAPVYPIYIVNAEWAIPFNFTLPPVDWFLERFFHVPFMPLPAGPAALLFPWMWYLTLPARMIYVVGEPIDVLPLVREAGITRFDRSEREKFQRVAETLRRQMQRDLDRQVERYGRFPYQWRSLRHKLAAAPGRLGRVLPLGWPVTFVRHARDRHRPPARSRLHAVLRDWDLIGYYLPLGWPLLSLARRLRRPPCGYRGLSRGERNRKEGNFIWHLAERPLPPRPHPGPCEVADPRPPVESTG